MGEPCEIWSHAQNPLERLLYVSHPSLPNVLKSDVVLQPPPLALFQDPTQQLGEEPGKLSASQPLGKEDVHIPLQLVPPLPGEQPTQSGGGHPGQTWEQCLKMTPFPAR